MNAGRPSASEVKWIRLQEIGLVLLLSLPASLLVAVLVTGGIVRGGYAHLLLNWFLLATLILGTTGAICIWYGQGKRRELQDKEEEEEKDDILKEGQSPKA